MPDEYAECRPGQNRCNVDDCADSDEQSSSPLTLPGAALQVTLEGLLLREDERIGPVPFTSGVDQTRRSLWPLPLRCGTPSRGMLPRSSRCGAS
ncbi:hypothetical protein GCM10009745_58130 [Kribbella yunnanensis]|uniref:Uncharacterized protein n=1 Tax=Kribbella yunnanensis TaxID=190194 RepID=A0ABN2IE66_9ACTN